VTHGETRRRVGLDGTLQRDALLHRALNRVLSTWEQGHILAGVPIAWVAPNGVDPVTGLYSPTNTDSVGSEAKFAGQRDDPKEGATGPHDSDDRVAARLPVVVWDEIDVAADDPAVAGAAMSESGFAIITSQTCDIQATGPGSRHTHVQVSPVVRLDHEMNPDRLKAAKNGTVVELVHLPDFAEHGDWFADLRLSLPVSKGVLATQVPRKAFPSGSAAQHFAERVAVKTRRPALHNAIDTVLRESLRDIVTAAMSGDDDWPTQIEQFRIQVSAGDRLEPASVTILVICFAKLGIRERKALKEWRRKIARQFRRATTGCEIRLRFTTIDQLGVRDYRDSVFMHVPALAGSVFW